MSRILLVLLALTIGLPAAAESCADGGATLMIAYRTPPGDRLAFRREMAEKGLARLQELKEQGVLQAYRVLANRYVETGEWDVMALLRFSKGADLERWKSVEQSTPAGLGDSLLAHATAIASVPADMIRQDAAAEPTAPGKSVFLVIPYQYLVPVRDYETYLDGYTLPQLKGWIGEGVLSGYGLYLSRYPAGRPWNAMLLLEYRDDKSLAARDEVVARVRSRLKDNPDWSAWADNKKTIRSEGVAIVADELVRAGQPGKAAGACY